MAINLYFNTSNKNGMATSVTLDPVSYFAAFQVKPPAAQNVFHVNMSSPNVSYTLCFFKEITQG